MDKHSDNKQLYTPCNESRFFPHFQHFFSLLVSEGFKAHLQPCHCRSHHIDGEEATDMSLSQDMSIGLRF